MMAHPRHPGATVALLIWALARASEATATSEPGPQPAALCAYVANLGNDTVSVVDVAGRRPLTSIVAGDDLSAWGVAVSHDGQFAYVTDDRNAYLSVISTEARSVVSRIPVDSSPRGVAVTPDGTTALVACFGKARVDVVDLVLAETRMAIPVAAGPGSVAIAPDGARAYVSHSLNEGHVTEIDIATAKATAEIDVKGAPQFLVVTNDGSKVLAPEFLSGEVLSIDTVTHAITHVPTGHAHATDVAVSPVGTRAYVAHSPSEPLTVLDTDTLQVLGSIDAPGTSVAVASDGTRLYTNGCSGLCVVDLAIESLLGTVPTAGPFKIALTPDGALAFVTNPYLGTLSIIDTAAQRVVRTLGSNRPINVVAAPDGRTVYVMNAGLASVSVLDTASRRITETIGVGESPFGAAVSPDGRTLYVANTISGTVSVINTESRQVTGEIAVGRSPWAITLNAAGTSAYVPNAADDTVSVVDTALRSVTATYAVGDIPYDVVPSPDEKYLYVANVSSHEVEILDLDTGEAVGRIATAYPRALAIAPDGGRLYVVNDVVGRFTIIDTATRQVIRALQLSHCPPGFVCLDEKYLFDVALTPDGRTALVTARDLSRVIAIDTRTFGAAIIEPLGEQPTGIAIAQVPGGCGAADTPTPTPTRTPTPTPTRTPTPSPTPLPCAGDCDGSRTVSVDELVSAVTIALGDAAVDLCAPADGDGDQLVTVDDLVTAVRMALDGWP
jgi:YVTN family beta-propeller protein